MEKEKLIAKLEEEYEALKEKLSKLIAFLNKENVEEEIGGTQMALLITQESAMQIYLNTLAMRLDDLMEEEEPEEGNPKEESKAADNEEDAKAAEFVKDIADLLGKYMNK